jgi:hypothetical protein
MVENNPCSGKQDTKKPTITIIVGILGKYDRMKIGGKCKFRTCDPCSVNAVLYP